MTPAGPGPQERDFPSEAARQTRRRQTGASVLIGLALLAVLLLLVSLNHGTARMSAGVMAPPRPAGVPVDAVLRDGAEGGYYIRLQRQDLRLADGRRLPAFQIGAWDSHTGEQVFVGAGIFVLDRPSARPAAALIPPGEAEILRSASFDGRELRFDISGQPRGGRIIVLDVPLGQD